MRFSVTMMVAAFGITGCADFSRGPAPVDAGSSKSPDSATALVADPTFETTVYPILLLDCEGCHRIGSDGEFTKFVLTGNARMDRANTVATVTPGDPANSSLLLKATGHNHTGRERFTVDSQEYQTIASWVAGLESSTPAGP